ncbi:6-carboxytetrahydropterin synthase [Psychromonas antarctica]|uniref:6-carboxytetrahydropterin synthase n=1 Tax=Psychromonas antarctica TaxID=67573 RepID=UPI001EE798ED|nr:6-carboxytetrahydropterin synthase [Psychromonas antarctica]MCG6201320.1 6-carboxytetrahydropterin synthase [Psychromonas antarctica]
MKLFVRDLTVIDASYLDATRGFVGESYQVDIVLQGSLNEQSMILDFSSVKKQIKAIIDTEVDHKLLVPHASENCSVVFDSQRTQVNFKLADNSVIQLKCPNEAYCLLESETISAALLETYLEQVILLQLPDNILDLEVKLRNEKIDTPYYHYTHGLKKHNGNCQRIAHGHRSKIDIFIDDIYNKALVKDWANRWHDIYLASRDDVVDKSDLSFIVIKNEMDKLCTAYHAPQGYFELLMPAHKAEVLPRDTTVEELANFICEQIKARMGDKKVTVYAYEGIGKGAIAEL